MKYVLFLALFAISACSSTRYLSVDPRSEDKIKAGKMTEVRILAPDQDPDFSKEIAQFGLFQFDGALQDKAVAMAKDVCKREKNAEPDYVRLMFTSANDSIRQYSLYSYAPHTVKFWCEKKK